MRGVISQIGSKVGLNCIYWRYGLHGYDKKTNARVLMQQSIQEDWSGEITVSACGARAEELAEQMVNLLNQACQRLNLSPVTVTKNRISASVPDFAPDPNRPKTFFVSYAWEDESDPSRANIVNAFCDRAEEEGIHIIRDRTAMEPGDRISDFMTRLAEGDRILIVLSDKYFKSPYCMTELYNIWLQSRGDDRAFHKKVRIFSNPDARIWTRDERSKIVEYWTTESEKLDRPKFSTPGDENKNRFYKKLVAHLGEILDSIVNTLQPKDFEELIEYALD